VFKAPVHVGTFVQINRFHSLPFANSNNNFTSNYSLFLFDFSLFYHFAVPKAQLCQNDMGPLWEERFWAAVGRGYNQRAIPY
jgi:hypothetical protein